MCLFIPDFEQKYAVGKIGESLIANWFRGRGFNVLPVYEKEIKENKGPTLFLAEGGSLICPDMLVFKPGKTLWIEAKHKTAFSWHRITQRWVTGIDLRHYSDYLKVAEGQWPVWLLFLHQDGTAKDTPEGLISPTGLFGNDIKVLKTIENHRSDKYGRSGMVYWSHDKLKQIAILSDIQGGFIGART